MRKNQKSANTRKAESKAKDWMKRRYSIYRYNNDDTKVLLELNENERFVPMYDYRHRNGLDLAYLVSDYGRVISFKGQEPRWLKENYTDRDYPTVGDDWRSHVLVWFSFTADAILKGETVQLLDCEIPPYEWKPSITTLTGRNRILKNLQTFVTEKFGRLYRIHHIDRNTHNSYFGNLRCVVNKNHTVFHDLINAVENNKELSTERVAEMELKMPTIIRQVETDMGTSWDADPLDIGSISIRITAKSFFEEIIKVISNRINGYFSENRKMCAILGNQIYIYDAVDGELLPAAMDGETYDINIVSEDGRLKIGVVYNGKSIGLAV